MGSWLMRSWRRAQFRGVRYSVPVPNTRVKRRGLRPKAECVNCGRMVAVRKDGKLYAHNRDASEKCV